MSNESRIAVIGLGTLGGFVAQTVSELNYLRKLTLIDFDIVEEKNLTNSIYRKSDIGRYKTTALHDIIQEQNNIEIEIITEKYEEYESIIPEVDLIIDCRDYVCNRGDEIDVRLFISSRYLVIDCRQNVSYDKSYEGRYITQLTKNDLRRAALILTSFMQDGFLDYMKNNKIIKEIDLDYLHKVSSDIKNQNEDRNIIIDPDISKKLLNLEGNIKTIVQENKHKDVIVTLGDKKISPLSKMIPKNSSLNDIIYTMSQMTNTIYNQSQYYYIVSINDNDDDDVCNIELIQETGAA